MASTDLDVTGVLASTGWAGASVANLSGQNDVRATGGQKNEVIRCDVTDVPGDFGSMNTVTLHVEGRRGGTGNRTLSFTVDLLDSAQVVLETFTTPNLGTSDVPYDSAAFTRSDAQAVIDGYQLRVTVNEGGGMPGGDDTSEIDRMWVTLDYTVASAGTTVVLEIAAETDAALAVVPARSVTLGQATETDQVAPVSPSKSVALGLAEEFDALLPITPTVGSPVVVQLGIATETDSALAVSAGKVVTLGMPVETDEVTAFTPAKSVTLGQAQETDHAFALAVSKSVAMGVATETDSALQMTPRVGAAIVVVLGIATEVDDALGITPVLGLPPSIGSVDPGRLHLMIGIRL